VARDAAEPGDLRVARAVSSAMERGPAAFVRPRVALLFGPEDRALSACLRQAVAATTRFRLVDEEDVAQLNVAQGRGWARALARPRAAALAQTVAADIAVFRVPAVARSGEALVALDVLTHDQLGHQALAAASDGAACARLAAELQRVVHSEGQVIAVQGQRATVDLGWRSRVAPGAQLELSRHGRAAGTLTVVEVQLDRCTAQGVARVGDRVRLVDR
jgi:hypothetical protein